MKYTIPDYLIEKTVDIWCKALHTPKFDNGDNSMAGAITSGLMISNNDAARGKVDMPEAIEKFRVNLTKILKGFDYSHLLSVDYGPCQELADAAEGTGITDSMFSIKSSVYTADDHVSASFGYAAPSTKFYKVGDKWVLTKSELDADERDEILNAIIDGRLKGFTIED